MPDTDGLKVRKMTAAARNATQRLPSPRLLLSEVPILSKRFRVVALEMLPGAVLRLTRLLTTAASASSFLTHCNIACKGPNRLLGDASPYRRPTWLE